MQNEIWKDIDGHQGYQISSMGRIRSFHKREHGKWHIANIPQRILRYGMRTGYYTVHLTNPDRVYLVHHLVALTFIGPRPEGFEICHNDGSRTNNQVENLRYDTHTSNSLDCNLHGTSNSKLSATDVLKIRERIADNEPSSDVASDYNISTEAVGKISSGARLRNLPGPITRLCERPTYRRLSDSDVADIRRRHTMGETQTSLAQEYQCSVSLVCRIVHNQRRIGQRV